MTIGEDNCGESGKLKTLRAYPNANVTLDFSGESYDMTDTSKNDRGLQLDGDYWHIYGIKITGAADNGMYVTGNNNIVEFCEFDGNRDTGLQISRKSSSLSDIKTDEATTLFLSCTSCNNLGPCYW